MKKWIKAARLRTLSLSLSGGILAGMIAHAEGKWNGLLFFLFIFTIFCFQIISNFANDLGDALKGTDENRTGEKRMVSSGEITPKSMKNAVILMSIIAFTSGALALIKADLPQNIWLPLGVLALFALWAAIQYTIGKNAFGYAGWGDVFVFIFFGLASVSGGHMLLTGEFNLYILFPAASVGLLSSGVLNLNNMRDMENDKLHEKNTLVVKNGVKFAKRYHTILLLFPTLLNCFYFWFSGLPKSAHLYILVVPLLFILLKKVMKTEVLADLDGELKKLAFATLIFALLTGIGHYM